MTVKIDDKNITYLCEKKGNSFSVTNTETGETKVYKLDYNSIADNSEFTLAEMFIESLQQCIAE